MGDAGPVLLGPNQPPRFYRGGAKIAAFRGGPARRGSDHLPEDWVGSATTVFGTASEGLTRLPDGRLLCDAICDDPQGYLGPWHAERFGASPALLVKLLDAGQRLPVHCHPGDAFAQTHLASAWGKTEAWIVIDAAPGSEVYIGFTEDVSEPVLAAWVAGQSPATLRALNRVPVQTGDAILIPAGLPHAIGEGVFLVELQEPTDLSVLLEWDSFPIDGPAEGHLGLGYDLALRCVDRSAWDPARLAALRRPAGAGAPVSSVFPREADPFFEAQRIRPAGGPVALGPAFAVLVVLSGDGLLRTEQGDELPLSRGMTVLLPHAAGRTEISGGLELIRCLAPNGGHRGAVA
ncbi:MAG TPA: class I mannose-6-phosphate isomerase [Streptosporangiaceae bacterium]|nr:class I mannose-6-phosphate isomerase [Streptosporangiaceae bacterium]